MSRRNGVGYLAAFAVIGITVVPLLFVILGGFRTTAQINRARDLLLRH